MIISSNMLASSLFSIERRDSKTPSSTTTGGCVACLLCFCRDSATMRSARSRQYKMFCSWECAFHEKVPFPVPSGSSSSQLEACDMKEKFGKYPTLAAISIGCHVRAYFFAKGEGVQVSINSLF
jgi:hypothetical protein